MSHRLTTGLALLGLLAAFTGSASATVLLNDTFATDGALNGAVPAPGPGAAWNAGSATGISAIQVAGGQVVVVQQDGTVGGVNGEDEANVFSDQAATGTTYARFDFRVPAADNAALATDADAVDGVFFVTLRGTSASTSQRARFGLLPASGGSGFRAAINADNSNLGAGGIWASDLAFDTTYRAVISYNAASGQSQFWLDPMSEMSTSVAHTAAGGTVINRIILRQNNDYAGKQILDNLVVASTFSEALSGGGTAFLPADFNKDTKVDATDLMLWSAGLSGGAAADADGDTDTDGADFLAWQQQFGLAPPSAGIAAAVPEPATGFIAVAAVIALALRRRRSN